MPVIVTFWLLADNKTSQTLKCDPRICNVFYFYFQIEPLGFYYNTIIPTSSFKQDETVWEPLICIYTFQQAR